MTRGIKFGRLEEERSRCKTTMMVDPMSVCKCRQVRADNRGHKVKKAGRKKKKLQRMRVVYIVYRIVRVNRQKSQNLLEACFTSKLGVDIETHVRAGSGLRPRKHSRDRCSDVWY